MDLKTLLFGEAIKVIKRALKSAIGPSIGVVIGGTVLPRTVFPHRYNDTYPPLLAHAGLSLAVMYAVCFLVCLFIEWVKPSFQSNRDSSS